MLQEVTLRSYCLQKTIMAHTEVCMCDGVMCKHLCDCVCVCVLTAPFSLQERVGEGGCVVGKGHEIMTPTGKEKNNMVLYISCKSEKNTHKETFTF